jgi:DNA-binding Lrp family transcriptional regulator
MTVDEEILVYLKKNPRSRPTTIAKELGKTMEHIHGRLRFLEASGKVVREDRGIWSLSSAKMRIKKVEKSIEAIA